MKQVWIGLGLLAVLFFGGIWVGSGLEQAHEQQIRDLEQARIAAMEENWNRAEAHLTRAQKQWDERRNLTAALYRHDELDQIDVHFAQLEAQLACRDRTAFCGSCALLAQNLQNLPQAHSFHWRNLL